MDEKLERILDRLESLERRLDRLEHGHGHHGHGHHGPGHHGHGHHGRWDDRGRDDRGYDEKRVIDTIVRLVCENVASVISEVVGRELDRRGLRGDR